MKFAYVIAAWAGWRRSDDPRAVNDRAFFLRTHLETLAKVKHDLPIVIVVPECPDEDKRFTQYLTTLPHRIIRRPNAGYSYGSFAEAFRQLRDEYAGFVFVEDDYVFVDDHFDQQLIEIALSKQNTGLVCGAALPWGPALHPAVALGLCTTAAMAGWERVRRSREGSLPCDDVVLGGYQSAEKWQIAWGHDLSEAGFETTDWLETRSTPYWAHGHVRWYGYTSAKPMVMPIQAIGRMTTYVCPQRSWHVDHLYEFGDFSHGVIF